jgi:hypothetical protein
MSTPGILAVGTREQWRGVEVTYDGTPDSLGFLVLRLLRRFGVQGVVKQFISAPWGWRSITGREARDSGWAPWFTPENPYSQTHFINWYVLDVEGGRLEVYDCNTKAWLEPVRIAADGRPLNRPDWVPEPPDWLPTRPAEVASETNRVRGSLRVRDIPLEQARAVVLAWMKGLVPGAEKGEWQLECAEDATCLSAWRLGDQLLWIPDRIEAQYSEFFLATEDCGTGLGTPSPEAWAQAAQRTGFNRKKGVRFVEELFSVAATPWANGPVRTAIRVSYPSDPTGPLDALKRKLFPPEPQLAHAPFFMEVGKPISHEQVMRLIERGEQPLIMQEDDGFHLGRDFTPPRGWLANLVRAVSVPVPAGSPGVPERRRAYFWPYDEA